MRDGSHAGAGFTAVLAKPSHQQQCCPPHCVAGMFRGEKTPCLLATHQGGGCTRPASTVFLPQGPFSYAQRLAQACLEWMMLYVMSERARQMEALSSSPLSLHPRPSLSASPCIGYLPPWVLPPWFQIGVKNIHLTSPLHSHLRTECDHT